MQDQGSSSQLLTIAEFAKLTRLTPKALHLYQEAGLIVPAAIDADTGYRRYHADQAYRARLIGLLRGADMSLTEIAALLADVDDFPEAAREGLDRYLQRLEAQHIRRRLLIRHVDAILRQEEPPMHRIGTRHVAAQRVLSIQRRLTADETDRFVAEAKAAFTRQLDGRQPTGPFTLIFHGIVDHDSDGPLEAILGCPDDVSPSELIGVRTEPAHDEAFATITKAEWDYPAILAAYDAVACSPEVTGRPRSRLSCREVYLAEPDGLDDADLICDIAFPLG